MTGEPILVLSSFPDVEQARRILEKLVGENLVACGNIIPGVESIYSWKGKMESSSETLVIFKTIRANYKKLERALISLHSYEVPEIISVDISAGHPAYLDWLIVNCNSAAVK